MMNAKALKKLFSIFIKAGKTDILEKVLDALSRKDTKELENLINSLDEDLKQEFINWLKEFGFIVLINGDNNQFIKQGNINQTTSNGNNLNNVRIDGDFVSGDKIVNKNNLNIFIKKISYQHKNKEKINFSQFSQLIKYKYLKEKDFFYFKPLFLKSSKKHINNIYVDLVIIPKNPFFDDLYVKNNKEKFLKIEDIVINFYKFETLILGKPGAGKTLLSKYIINKWINGEILNKFDLIIYLPLRNWEGSTLKENIFKFYLYEYQDIFEIDMSNILNEKIFFIFDGYDELPYEYKKVFNKEIKYLRSKQVKYLITSRPYSFSFDEFKNIKEIYEIKGFSFKDINQYIDKLINNDNAIYIKNLIKNNINIKHICTIPLILEIIIFLINEKLLEKKSLNITLSEIYLKIVNLIWEKHEKEKIYESSYIYSNDLKNLLFYKEEIFILLGKISTELLVENKRVVKGKELKEILAKQLKNTNMLYHLNLDKIFYFILNSGYFFSNNKDLLELNNTYTFIHASFQDFFAAYYLSFLEENNIINFTKKYKYNKNFQSVFVFIAGLLEKEGKEYVLLNEFKTLENEYIVNLTTKIISNLEVIKDKNLKRKITKKFIEYKGCIKDFTISKNLDIEYIYNLIFENKKIFFKKERKYLLLKSFSIVFLQVYKDKFIKDLLNYIKTVDDVIKIEIISKVLDIYPSKKIIKLALSLINDKNFNKNLKTTLIKLLIQNNIKLNRYLKTDLINISSKILIILTLMNDDFYEDNTNYIHNIILNDKIIYINRIFFIKGILDNLEKYRFKFLKFLLKLIKEKISKKDFLNTDHLFIIELIVLLFNKYHNLGIKREIINLIKNSNDEIKLILISKLVTCNNLDNQMKIFLFKESIDLLKIKNKFIYETFKLIKFIISNFYEQLTRKEEIYIVEFLLNNPVYLDKDLYTFFIKKLKTKTIRKKLIKKYKIKFIFKSLNLLKIYFYKNKLKN